MNRRQFSIGHNSLSVIVHDLDFIRVPVVPVEAHAPPIIHANAALPASIPFKFFEAIARRNPQIVKRIGRVQGNQFSEHRPKQIRRKSSYGLSTKEPVCIAIGEALYHNLSITAYVNTVKRYYLVKLTATCARGADGLKEALRGKR